MNCPHCGDTENRVVEARDHGNHVRRSRLCRGCGRTFTTAERVSTYWGRRQGWVDQVDQPEPAPLHVVASPPAAPEEKVARKPRGARFMPKSIDDDRIDKEAKKLLLEWWTEARWSRHKSRATWTEAAWRASLERVAQLPARQQIQLAQGGVEHGWQALKPDYVGLSPAFSSTGGPMPSDPRMKEAMNGAA